VGDSIAIDQYLALRHVAFKSGRHGLPHFETWMANRYGDERRVEVVAHSFYLLPRLVVGTARIATMHTRLAKQLAGSLPIRLVRPTSISLGSSKYCNGTSIATWIPGSMWLRDVIIEGARALPPLEN